ncbi:MAG: tRNA lysidine(34) synthetase TilS [Spirochaetaceae bacterium]|jgi:tRNA(Ile)-lysidine synthetase-like protein|nr:tRNA lysidine(34) synthetase TilS [Spirochaetaceae bacterium]
MSLLNAVADALTYVPEDAVLLAAVSGGADSQAMLAACASIRGRAFCEKGGLRAVHVDHGLRPIEECAADADAARVLCGRLGVGCTVAAVGRGRIEAWARDEGSGIEAAARHFRYKALRREAERAGADFILVAHTQDDALETALMRFLRGAGPRGLALMPRFAPVPGIGDSALRGDRGGVSMTPSGVEPLLRGAPDVQTEAGRAKQAFADAPLGVGAGLSAGVLTGGRGSAIFAATSPHPMIFRPLRDVTRQEVLDFLAEQGLSYRTDSTNGNVRYLRNRVRLCLVPVLDENFPEWRKGLLETAETQGFTADFIENEREKRVLWGRNGENQAVVIENLDGLPEILREEALFAAIDRLKDGEKSVKRQVVRDFARDERVKAADVGGGIRVNRTVVRVGRDEAFYEKGFSLLIKDAGEYRINGLRIEAAKVNGGLVVHIKGTQHGE